MLPSWKGNVTRFIVLVLFTLLANWMFKGGTISRIVLLVLIIAFCYLIFCAPDTLLEKIIPERVWKHIVRK